MKTTAVKNNKAQDVFVSRVNEARKLMKLLSSHVDDHMDVDPERVNWADAGDAGRLVELLREAARGCNLIEE